MENENTTIAYEQPAETEKPIYSLGDESVSETEKDDFYDEFLSIMYISRTSACIRNISCAVIYIMCIVLIIAGDASLATNFLILFFIFAFLPHILRIARHKKMLEMMKKNTQFHSRYDFYDDRMEISKDGSVVRTLKLSTLKHITESDNYIILTFSDKIGYCFSKNTRLAGRTDEFCEYLRKRTGKKKSRAVSIKFGAKYVIALIVAFILLFGGAIAANAYVDNAKNAPKTFTYGEYSVTLTERFHEYLDDLDLFLTDEKCWLFMEADDELADYTLEELYEFEVDSPEYEDVRIVSKNIDSIQFEFTDRETDQYCFMSINKTDDCVYYSVFFCSKTYKSRYENKIPGWADSITIDCRGGEL